MTNFWEKLDQELRTIYENYLHIQDKGRNQVDSIHPLLLRSDFVPVLITVTGEGAIDTITSRGFHPKRKVDTTTYLGMLNLKDLEQLASLEAVHSVALYKKDKTLDSPPVIDPQLSRYMDQPKTKGVSKDSPHAKHIPHTLKVVGALVKFRTSPAFLSDLGCTVNTVVGNIASVLIPQDQLKSVTTHPELMRIEITPRFREELDDSIDEINAKELRNGEFPFSGADKFTGSGTIVAILDSGFNYAHKVFRDPSDETKSRILFLYDQRLSRQSGDTVPQNSSGGNLIGVEYNKMQIESAIALVDSGSDPTSVVRHDMGSHGTHVAGIAAGNGLQSGNCHGSYHYVGVAPEADLILVRYRSGGDQIGESSNIVDAIDYVIGKAESLSQPAVINMSFGDAMGAHDGTSLLEEAIDTFLTTDHPSVGFSIVKSAGNLADEEQHARTTIPWDLEDDSRSLIMKVVPPDDDDGPTDILIDIWYDVSELDITINPPGGTFTGTNTVSPAAGAGNTVSFTENTNNSTVTITSQDNVSNGKNRIYIEIETDGTDPVLSGNWEIILKNALIGEVTMDAWIERDTPATWTTFETSERTISIPGTSREIITVGNYIYKGKNSNNIKDSSSRGPTADDRRKPDLAAPGTSVMSARFDPNEGSCCDCCYDFYVAKTGTSMAAPHVTGVIALMLEKDSSLTHTDIKDKLINHTNTDDLSDATPNNIFGHGKLDAALVLGSVSSTSNPVGPEITERHTFPATSRTATHQNTVLHPVHTLAEGTPLKRIIQTELGEKIYRLSQKHYEHIRNLINTNKKMATVWHRNNGPVLVHHVIRCVMMPSYRMPEAITEKPISQILNNIVEALKIYSHHDKELSQDLDYVLPLAHQLTGKSLHELVEDLEEDKTIKWTS